VFVRDQHTARAPAAAPSQGPGTATRARYRALLWLAGSGDPTPYTLHPKSSTLNSTGRSEGAGVRSYTCTLHPTPHTLHSKPTNYTLHPKPSTLNRTGKSEAAVASRKKNMNPPPSNLKPKPTGFTALLHQRSLITCGFQAALYQTHILTHQSYWQSHAHNTANTRTHARTRAGTHTHTYTHTN
jgi:hypothetical protein